MSFTYKVIENQVEILIERILIFFYVFHSFLTYCDFMAITILHEIIEKSFKIFADILTAHDVSGPSEYELLNTIIDKKLELPRPSEYPQVCICYVIPYLQS